MTGYHTRWARPRDAADDPERIAIREALGGVGFEPDGAEVVSAGEADVCVEGGGEAAQEGMVGSVPPSSMRSMSSSVREARMASSTTVRPRAVRMSYRALPNAKTTP
jgi:hypothetical protein